MFFLSAGATRIGFPIAEPCYRPGFVCSSMETIGIAMLKHEARFAGTPGLKFLEWQRPRPKFLFAWYAEPLVMVTSCEPSKRRQWAAACWQRTQRNIGSYLAPMGRRWSISGPFRKW